MKKYIFILITVLFYNISFSQESKKDYEIKTILGKETSNGVYFGISGNCSEIDNENVLFLGSRIGWVINHKLTIGLAGYGFVNNTINLYEENYNDLIGGYGGLFFEPVIGSRHPVHVDFPIIIGVGGINKSNNFEFDYNQSDLFYIIEPGVELEFNFLKWLRMSAGASYRYSYDLYLPNSSNYMLDGISIGMSLKMGIF